MESLKAAGTTIGNTLAENFGGVAQNAAPAEHQFSLDQVPDLSSKVAVVTGGSEGIGYGCTHTLLNRNISKIYILGLHQDVAEKAKEAVAKDLGQKYADRTHWIECNLGNWKKTAEVANEIASSTDRLDILINNAARGIMTQELHPVVGVQGVDNHMAANHMGHVILTSHLLPLLKKTASQGNIVRIVTLASNAHQSASKDTKFASLEELNTELGPNEAYGRSKLAQLLYARWLNKHLTSKEPKILANAVHPGFVSTKASKEMIHEAFPLAGYAMSVGMEPFKKDQFEGCISAMYCATMTTKSGQYICPPAIPEPGSELAQNEALGEQLMKLTVELVQDKTYSDSKAKGCPFTLA